MNFFTALQQMCGSGGCFGSAFGGGSGCFGNACTNLASSAVNTATTATSALGGFSGLLTMLCKLFGLGC